MRLTPVSRVRLAAVTARALPSLLSHPRASRQQVASFRVRRLRAMVAHAYRSVPYYRALFDRAGLTPGDIRTIGDLERIPISAREDMQRAAPDQITARGLDPSALIQHATSGSSGRPLTMRRTWMEERLLNTLRRRALGELGVRVIDRVTHITLPRPPHPNDNQLARRVAQRLRIYPVRRLDCRLPPEELLERLVEAPPDVLVGLSGVLTQIAACIGARDGAVVRPRAVVASGEVLTPHMRDRIGRAFDAPVFELYATFEAGVLAWQCPSGGAMHVCDDSVVLEVVRDGRPAEAGERGEVVLTALHSFAMPFLRYRLGDVVTRGAAACECGAPFSTIASIQGRMIDYFRLPAGRLLHPYEIVSILRTTCDWILQYRLIQARENRIVLQILPAELPAGWQLAELRERIEQVVGTAVEVQLEIVASMPLESTGKFRVSRSFVHSEYDGVVWNQP